MTSTPTNERIAYAFLRFVFGINICFHGLSRLLGDHQAFLAYLDKSMATAVLIPKGTIPVFAAILPWVETTIGLLVLLGLFTRIALIAGSLVMVLLMAGITLAQDWNVAGTQLIYCIIYFVLLARLEWNRFSVDTLFRTPTSSN
jgi:thiosulfate dehydrogenase (quinone) large subunit